MCFSDCVPSHYLLLMVFGAPSWSCWSSTSYRLHQDLVFQLKLSIHFLYPLNLSQLPLDERQINPGQVASPSQRQTTMDEPRIILETPINLTCMFLGGGRKPENPERTHAYTGRTCRLHTERSQVGIEPGTLSREPGALSL